MHWPSFVNDACWARTKFIFPGVIKSLDSRPLLHKPQEKVLLQAMQFQRMCPRVWEERCTYHKPVLLSLMGSASHTSIQRALGVTQREFGALCWSDPCSSSYLPSTATLHVTLGLEHIKSLFCTRKHMFLLRLFCHLKSPPSTLPIEPLTQSLFGK